MPVPGHSGAAVLFGPTVCLNAVLPTPHTHTHTDVFCLFPLGLGSRVLGLGSRVFGSSWPISGSRSLLVIAMGPSNDGELRYKKSPTSCLWQAPASTQKTKIKTRPTIRRSARWGVSLPWILPWRKSPRFRFSLGVLVTSAACHSDNKRPLRALWGGWSPRPTAVPCLPLGRQVSPPLGGRAVAGFVYICVCVCVFINKIFLFPAPHHNAARANRRAVLLMPPVVQR